MATAQGLPAPISAKLARRWLALAEQRRDNFIDLYETGRWQLYYTEEQFIQRMRQAVELTETWRRHAGVGFTLDTPPLNLRGTARRA